MESSAQSAAVPQRGFGTGSLTEEGFCVHTTEVLGGRPQLEIKELLFTV